jgi:hypothetical protein
MESDVAMIKRYWQNFSTRRKKLTMIIDYDAASSPIFLEPATI